MYVSSVISARTALPDFFWALSFMSFTEATRGSRATRSRNSPSW